MNTSRAGSNMPCSRIQRRRARATSARFCSAAYRVFFEADVASVAETPKRAAAAPGAALVHRRNDLVQRQVRLLGDEREQEFRVLFQLRSASATWLCGNASGCFEALRPNHHHTGADPIVFGRRTPRCTADNVSDYSGTQVAGIRLGHGIPRHRIKDKRLPHWQAVGNPSDSSRAKFALVQDSSDPLGSNSTMPRQRAGIHVELTTNHLDALYEQLKGRGVEFFEPPHEEPWERSMRVHDPDGYTIEFAEGRRGHRGVT